MPWGMGFSSICADYLICARLQIASDGRLSSRQITLSHQFIGWFNLSGKCIFCIILFHCFHCPFCRFCIKSLGLEQILDHQAFHCVAWFILAMVLSNSMSSGMHPVFSSCRLALPLWTISAFYAAQHKVWDRLCSYACGLVWDWLGTLNVNLGSKMVLVWSRPQKKKGETNPCSMV